MAKEMLINVSEGEECRIALVQDGRLEELYMERTSATSHVGNIYKGRVTNVEPSIQAAFVDFGLGRNGFLHISDLLPTYFGRRGEEVHESVGRKMARRDRPPIQRCLRRGDEIVVQIIKEGIGTKGPTLSTYLSIPGRILVMMPYMSKLGVSRKIEDEEERRRLRQILDSLKPPSDAGFIIRTAGVGRTKAEIQKDLNYLTRLWQNMRKQIESGPAPMELYTEGDLVTRTVRDVFTSDIERIVVDNKDVARRVREFFRIAMPRTRNKVELYEEPIPLFHKYGIEREIEMMYSRHVPLPSGGSLVIDSTEAIVAIDVNSGRFRDHADAETTAFKTDMEAADEIPRQLRLRDLGGVIICDFIDLRFERHRRELERRLHENLRKDRAKTKMLRMSQFGIIEMTRQRMRPSLKRSIYSDCPFCKGTGLVKTPESMALDVMRRLAIAINDQRVARVELGVCPDVAFYLQNRKRAALAALESSTSKRIIIRSEQSLGMDEMNLQLFDARDGMVFLEELGMLPPSAQPTGPRGERQPQDGRRGQREGRDRRLPAPQRDRVEAPADRFDIDRLEDEVEQREERLLDNGAHAPVAAPAAAPSEPAAAPPEQPQATEQPAVAEAQPPEGGEQVVMPGEQNQGRSRGRRRRGRGRGRRGPRNDEPSNDAAGPPRPQPWPEAQPSAEEPRSAQPQTAALAAAEPTPASAAPASAAAPPAPPSDSAGDSQQAAANTSAPRSGRRRRGRGRRQTLQESAPSQAAPTAAAPPAMAPQVVRTGSTDRHLVADEPVFPPPMQRPRTYRDLDNIPDDLD
jgi:ribonuclease E